MRRILYAILLVVTALGLASCAIDQLSEAGPDGGGAPVSVDFNVGVRDALTKATPEATALDNAGGDFVLYVAAFDKADGSLSAASLIGREGFQPTATLSGGTAKVKMTLARNREYKVVFLAMKAGAYTPTFSDNSLARLTITEAKANDASMDAFCASVDVTAAKNTHDHEITLKRPFAQLNVLVPKSAVPQGQTSFNSTMKVKMPITYNLIDGKASMEAEVEFTENDISTAAFGDYNDTYNWIAMNYVFVPEGGEVEVTYFKESGMDAAIKLGKVPVKVNSRTNLVGDVYSKSLDLDFIVNIDSGFGDEEEVPGGGGTTPPAPTGSDSIIFANLQLENGTQYKDPFAFGSSTITFGAGPNDGKYYTTGAGMRIYGDGWATVASTKTITKIEYTFDKTEQKDGDVVKTFVPDQATFGSVDTGEYDLATQTWTGSANSVTLTRATGSGHWRLQKVTVYYGEDKSETILEHQAIGCFLPGQTPREYVKGEDQFVREYVGDALTFVLMKPADNEQIVISGFSASMQAGAAVTLTVNWKKGTTVLLSKSYDMTVVKVENKVWIADKRGYGFVIKK